MVVNTQVQKLIKGLNSLFRFAGSRFSFRKRNKLKYKNIHSLISFAKNQTLKSDYVRANTVTELFCSVQKFNQMIISQLQCETRKKIPFTSDDLILPDALDGLVPMRFMASTILKNVSTFALPYKVRGRYFYSELAPKHAFKKEGMKIFYFTQKERLISGFGQFFEKIASCIGINLKVFHKFHYFKNDDKGKREVLRAHDMPIEVHPKKSTSYWMGHSTCLINIPVLSSDNKSTAALTLITDPVEKHINRFLYPRRTPIARKIEDCPAIHVFLLSHNHLDHFMPSTIKKLLPLQPVMIVPEGNEKAFRKMGFQNVVSLSWWDWVTVDFEKNLKKYSIQICAVPANHWSGHGIFDTHKSLFCGYVLRTKNQEGDIYFSGDTAVLSQEHIDIMNEKFEFTTIFQPGGPDERRNELKFTHQASCEAIIEYFRLIVIPLYQKHKDSLNKESFIESAKKRRVVFMHTNAYKLANIHFDDTKESCLRVFHALKAIIREDRYTEKKEYQAMRFYEKEVFEKILEYAKSIHFARQSLTSQDVYEMLTASFVFPKIGSRTQLF